jgi:hypothetical protein
MITERRSLSQNIYSLWPRELTYNNKILVCAHNNGTLTMLSSALCSTILGALLARKSRNLCNLETSYHIIFCGVHWNSLTRTLVNTILDSNKCTSN